jgi:putative Mn2+ efflux pump MntP
MHYLTLLTFSLIIGMVPFSVALSSSVYRCIEWKETFRIALVFALIQTVMTAMGWGIGFSVKGLFYDMRIPVALMIMFFIAVRLFFDSWRKNRQIRIIISEDRRILLSFGLVTSINPALLGISLGMLYPGFLALSGFVFGVVFILVILGVRIGKLGMMNLGWIAEVLGALGLLIASCLILMQYLKLI